MRFFKLFCPLFICLTLTLSCTQSGKSQRVKKTKFDSEKIIKMNQEYISEDQELIKQFVEQEQMNMNISKTGMWYSIEKEGVGDLIKSGEVVKLEYTISLLDKTLCYSSDDTGLKEFLVGQGGVESGLEEGILLLKKGSKAVFIMPPYLAHGLVGNQDKIPARAILLYNVEVVDVQKN